MTDESPDLIAMVDQWVATFTATGEALAKVVGRYYRSLVAEGFAPDQALTLALAYQTAVASGRA